MFVSSSFNTYVNLPKNKFIIWLEPPLCVVFNWIIKVYTILVWNTISGSSNLDMCCYHCLILTLIFHLKVIINFFFFFFIIIITITIILVVIVLLLTIIYTINLSVVRPRSCRVIYYFDTPALGRRHQSFGRVNYHHILISGWCLSHFHHFHICLFFDKF